MEKKITLINDCREGQKPTHFCINKFGASYVFSSEEDMKKHEAEEKIFMGAEFSGAIRTGKLTELQPEEGEEPIYTIVPLIREGSGLRGTDQNYTKNNPFRNTK